MALLVPGCERAPAKFARARKSLTCALVRAIPREDKPPHPSCETNAAICAKRRPIRRASDVHRARVELGKPAISLAINAEEELEKRNGKGKANGKEGRQDRRSLTLAGSFRELARSRYPSIILRGAQAGVGQPSAESNGARTDNLVSKGAADGVLVSGYLRLPSSCAGPAGSWPPRHPLTSNHPALSAR